MSDTTIKQVVDFGRFDETTVPPIIEENNPEYVFRWSRKDKVNTWRRRGWEVHHLNEKEMSDLSYMFDKSPAGHPTSDTLEGRDVILIKCHQSRYEGWADYLAEKRKRAVKNYTKTERAKTQSGLDAEIAKEGGAAGPVGIEDVSMTSKRGRPPKQG